MTYSLLLLYRNTRSESCPFCRGSLKRVNSEDLWVLTCGNDVVDTETALKDDVLRFFLFINNLPKDIPDALFVMYYEYLFWYKTPHQWCTGRENCWPSHVYRALRFSYWELVLLLDMVLNKVYLWVILFIIFWHGCWFLFLIL